MYQADAKKTFQELKEVRVENNRLALQAEELRERNIKLERKYMSLVEKVGASTGDLDAVERITGHDGKSNKAKYNKDLAAQRDRQRELNPSRLEKNVDEPLSQNDGREFINSYDYYGENQANQKDYVSVQRN